MPRARNIRIIQTLRGIALATAVGFTATLALTPALPAKSGARAGAGAPSTIDLADADEPGPRLVVSGQVFRPDGETPAPGVTLYVYQTDRSGRYGTPGEVPRLRGWMTTDAEGRYEYRTIRPASYPNSRIAAHVHTQLWGGGVHRQWNRDLLFADDPLLGERERQASAAAGRFRFVCAPEVDAAGVARCHHDLRAKPVGDTFGANIEHGLVPKETP